MLDRIPGLARLLDALRSPNQRYDHQTRAVMTRVLSCESSCIDVGAHEGSFLQHALRLAPGGQHIAFEPLPHLAARLRLRYPRASIVEAAVTDRAGRGAFVHVRNDPAYSGLRERSYDRAEVELEQLEVKLVRLDDVIPVEQAIAFIKLDIEGGEFDALRGGVALLRRCRPVVVFEAGVRSSSYYAATPEATWTWLRREGYRLTTMARWLADEPDLDASSFVHNWQYGPDYYFLAVPAQPEPAARTI